MALLTITLFIGIPSYPLLQSLLEYGVAYLMCGEGGTVHLILAGPIVSLPVILEM